MKIDTGAVSSAGLGEEGVVVVGAIHLIIGLEAANAAEREVAVGGGVGAAGVLRDSRSQQREIGEAASIQRQIENGALVNHGGKTAGLGFHSLGLGRDGDGLARPCERHLKRNLGYAANIHV